MRLTTIRTRDGLRPAVLDGDLLRLPDTHATLLDIIRGGEEALADIARGLRTGPAIEYADAVPGPLLDPPSVRDFLTYEQHLAELTGAPPPDEWYEKPLFYFSNPGSVVASGDEVPIPPLVRQYDFELEIAAVVGRGGSDLSPGQAVDHIFGYTIMNDWSARDLQVHEFKFPMGPSKSKDGAITLGPVLVTADELADCVVDGRLALDTAAFLDDVRVGGDNSANMAWSFPDLVAFASRGAQVRPGDVLGSGTCGTGCLAELRRTHGENGPEWLRPGNTVRLEVEHLGAIHNTLVPGPDPMPIPPGRRARPSSGTATP
jgi:2-keto-4-pentenoate hydratase/2-oxohepta-3-ene-1,7-dioic acid hydratase in catechol pathway